MHEVGLMQQALQVALDEAGRQGATRIHRLTLRIGPLSGVDVEAMRFAFEVVTPETAADGATLDVEVAPVQCWCRQCCQLFEPAGYIFQCPVCGHVSDDLRQGREFDLVDVEVS